MTHTIESIRALLDSSDAAVYRAIEAIQARQTADEQAGHHTRHTNGIGWSKFDAPWMADMITKRRRWGSLTPKQLAVTRNKVKRYARQLTEIANERTHAFAGVAEQSAPTASRATMAPAVSAESDGIYVRLANGAICECENYDGEDICPGCKSNLESMPEGFGDF